MALGEGRGEKGSLGGGAEGARISGFSGIERARDFPPRAAGQCTRERR